MSAKRYRKTIETEQVRVVGGDVAELAFVANSLVISGVADDNELTWHIQGDTVVFEWSMGGLLTGGTDFREGD